MIEYNDYFQLKNPFTRIKSKISYRARQKMYATFMQTTLPTEQSKILDIGVTPDISLPENNFLEKWYPWTQNIVMASIEDASNLEKVFTGAKFVRTVHGEAFPFGNSEFDIVFCSAVLEHIGDYSAQAFFVNECLRVGKKVFLTTPNKYFPIEFHTYLPFAHLLPRKTHQAILHIFRLEFFAKTENLNLVTVKDIKKMLNDSSISTRNRILFNRTLGVKSNIILVAEH